MITCTTKEKVGNGILKKQMAGVVFPFFFFWQCCEKIKNPSFQKLDDQREKGQFLLYF